LALHFGKIIHPTPPPTVPAFEVPLLAVPPSADTSGW
jgi:hypothetical protein